MRLDRPVTGVFIVIFNICLRTDNLHSTTDITANKIYENIENHVYEIYI